MELGYLFLRFLVALIKWTTFPLRKIYFCAFTTRIPIPPVEEELFFYSATKMAKMIRNKEVSSETVIKTYISRIKAINSILNAVVEDRFLEAIEEARRYDQLLDKPNINLNEIAKTKPLLGVPVTIKETCAVKDLSLVVGCTFLRGTKAKADGAAVTKLRAAGAIPLLVSTTSELCLSISCETLVTGRTRNPYNTNYTSGGSSGGEGALIGSGSSLIGIGSDLTGSIRIPAMFNGIFGHKPTARLVPCEGHWPMYPDEKLLNYLTIGPLTRYAEDLKLMMKIISVPNKINFDLGINLKDINLYFIEDVGFCLGANSIQPEIKEAVRNVVNYIHETYKVQIREEKFSKLSAAAESFTSMLGDVDNKFRLLEDPNNPDVKYSMIGQLVKYLFSEAVVTPNGALIDAIFLGCNALIPRSHASKHYKRMESLRNQMIDRLKHNGILIMPTFPVTAFHPVEIVWNMINCIIFCGIFNGLGFPCTQVPMGFDKKGMPIGVQIISAPYQDNLCIAVAEALEKQFGGWRPPFETTYTQ
ncbi:hypothetical protein Trydic_g21608 [Trypoxylus dichotomus]